MGRGVGVGPAARSAADGHGERAGSGSGLSSWPQVRRIRPMLPIAFPLSSGWNLSAKSFRLDLEVSLRTRGAAAASVVRRCGGSVRGRRRGRGRGKGLPVLAVAWSICMRAWSISARALALVVSSWASRFSRRVMRPTGSVSVRLREVSLKSVPGAPSSAAPPRLGRGRGRR